jgi:hypothetical protein
MVTEDAAYQCGNCRHVIQLKRGQLLPPCTRCGGTMEKIEGPPPEPERKTCG